MPKRIAVFCDGTWNRGDAKHPTNVRKLCRALAQSGGGVAQTKLYYDGVGSSKAWSLDGVVDRLGGGAFGWGLDAILQRAYEDLAIAYEPGDDVFLFGFSRGAYTARSLAGLIRACGIPDASNRDHVPRALARYRRKDEETHPDHEHSFEFRAVFSPGVTTSDEEAAWRTRHGLLAGHPLRLAYSGVWDTVGALGVPNFLRVARFTNQKYQFHDTKLSSFVRAARHAVAIDERRETFPPTLWFNLDELNRNSTPGPNGPRYRQHWFPGDHGSVGGGGDVTGLSDAALLWIAEGAEDEGLAFDPAEMAGYAAKATHLAPLVNSTAPPGVFGRFLKAKLADRQGPALRANVSAVASARFNEAPTNLPEKAPYKPPPLAHFPVLP